MPERSSNVLKQGTESLDMQNDLVSLRIQQSLMDCTMSTVIVLLLSDLQKIVIRDQTPRSGGRTVHITFVNSVLKSPAASASRCLRSKIHVFVGGGASQVQVTWKQS